MLQLYTFRKNDKAISPAIAVVLMVAVTLLLSVAIGFSVLDIGNETAEPRVAEGVSASETQEGVTLQWNSGGNSETLQVNVDGEQLGELNEIGDSITLTAPENATITVTDSSDTSSVYTNTQTTQDTTANTGGTSAVVGEPFFNVSNVEVNSPGTQTIAFQITEEEYIGETARIIIMGDKTDSFAFPVPVNEPEISYFASDIISIDGNGELNEFRSRGDRNVAYFDYKIDEDDIEETVTVELSDIHTRNSGSLTDDATMEILENEFNKQSEVEYDDSDGIPDEFINPEYTTQNQLENGYNNSFIGSNSPEGRGGHIQNNTIVFSQNSEDIPQYTTGEISYNTNSELVITFEEFGETNELRINALKTVVITENDLNENGEYIMTSDDEDKSSIIIGGYNRSTENKTEINEQMVIESVELNNAEVRLFD